MSVVINGTTGVNAPDFSGAGPSLTGVQAASGPNSSPFSFRNKIINGGCQVAQRGLTAVVNGSVTYGGCDRIFVLPSSFTTCTGNFNQQTGVVTVTGYTQGGSFTTTGTGDLYFGTRLESKDVSSLNSKAVTIKVGFYQSSGSSKNAIIRLDKATAGVDNFSTTSTVATSSSTPIPSGTLTYVTLTTTLGASDAINGLQVMAAFTGIGAGTASYYTGDWQLELGSIATPFEHRPIGTELALCQRYYETGNNHIYNPVAGSVTLGIGTRYAVPKRATPIVSVTAGTVEQNGPSDFRSFLGVSSGSWYVFSFTASAEL